jgi:type VI secretion system secreted protein VgrG
MSALFSFHAAALDDVRVLSLRGREALSEPFRFEIGLHAGREVDAAAVVGERAELRAELDGAADFGWRGVIAELSLLHAWDGQLLYRAILVPRLWQLGLSLHSRVFVGDDTPSIIEQILQQNGMTDYELRLRERYPAHQHVCQYKESDLAFISRWMEREGLYYFFEHGAADKLVITDAASFHGTLRADPVRYDPRALLDASAGEALHALSSRHAALPAAVEVRDYDPLKPGLEVFGEASLSGGLGVRQRLFGDNVLTPDDGKRLARVRSEEHACRRVVFHGSGHILRMRSGHRFEVDGHPCAAFNGALLCTELEHFANLGVDDPTVRQLLEVAFDDTYRVELRAITADVQYRAARLTPTPRIHGIERATIDGPDDSQYAQIDAHGRYKLKIHFDESELKDGNASSWVRMLQPHGGDTEGFHFPLRKGTEVMLAFQGGDPDQPLIAGVAPNAHKVSPVAEENATWNVIQTGSENRIRINDDKGREYIDISIPYDKSIFALGYPTTLKGFGSPPHDVAASVFLGSQGTAAFFFGGDWEIEVTGNKNELISGDVNDH